MGCGRVGGGGSGSTGGDLSVRVEGLAQRDSGRGKGRRAYVVEKVGDGDGRSRFDSMLSSCLSEFDDFSSLCIAQYIDGISA